MSAGGSDKDLWPLLGDLEPAFAIISHDFTEGIKRTRVALEALWGEDVPDTVVAITAQRDAMLRRSMTQDGDQLLGECKLPLSSISMGQRLQGATVARFCVPTPFPVAPRLLQRLPRFSERRGRWNCRSLHMVTSSSQVGKALGGRHGHLGQVQNQAQAGRRANQHL